MSDYTLVQSVPLPERVELHYADRPAAQLPLAKNPHLRKQTWKKLYTKDTSANLAEILLEQPELDDDQVAHAINVAKERRVRPLLVLFRRDLLTKQQRQTVVNDVQSVTLARTILEGDYHVDLAREMLASANPTDIFAWLRRQVEGVNDHDTTLPRPKWMVGSNAETVVDDLRGTAVDAAKFLVNKTPQHLRKHKGNIRFVGKTWPETAHVVLTNSRRLELLRTLIPHVRLGSIANQVAAHIADILTNGQTDITGSRYAVQDIVGRVYAHPSTSKQSAETLKAAIVKAVDAVNTNTYYGRQVKDLPNQLSDPPVRVGADLATITHDEGLDELIAVLLQSNNNGLRQSNSNDLRQDIETIDELLYNPNLTDDDLQTFAERTREVVTKDRYSRYSFERAADLLRWREMLPDLNHVIDHEGNIDVCDPQAGEPCNRTDCSTCSAEKLQDLRLYSAVHGETAKAVGEMLADLLGDDPGRWDLLPDVAASRDDMTVGQLVDVIEGVLAVEE